MPEWKVTVDLTSRDLQSGTIQLPGRLQSLPPPGELLALDTETSASHALHLEAPRELRGLASYFTAHALRPNDAVRLTLKADGSLTLEAVRRQRRRSASTPEGRHRAAVPPAAEPEQDGSPPPEAGDIPGYPATPPGEADGQTELAPAQEAPASPAVEAPDDPFAGFDPAGGLDDYPEGDDLDIRPLDLGSPPGPDSGPDGGSEEARPEQEPATTDSAPEGLSPGAQRKQGNADTAGFYTLAYRRPFRSQAATGPVLQEASAPAGSERPEPGPAAGDDVKPETPVNEMPARNAGRTLSAAEKLQAYLQRPDLPAIIRISLLAGELQVDPEELAAAAKAYASQPDSRLSNVRPDFYLFKRSRD
jgi:hypothetical protein